MVSKYKVFSNSMRETYLDCGQFLDERESLDKIMSGKKAPDSGFQH
jgi:hypothetical protein